MKNHRFLWLRNRTTDNRKCEKARNIKEKRTIEMFNTVSKQLVAHLSSPSANLLKIPETQRFMFIGTQCDLWGRPDGTGHEKNKSREFPSTYFFFDPKFI